jgi:hypothetical protein
MTALENMMIETTFCRICFNWQKKFVLLGTHEEKDNEAIEELKQMNDQDFLGHTTGLSSQLWTGGDEGGKLSQATVCS